MPREQTARRPDKQSQQQYVSVHCSKNSAADTDAVLYHHRDLSGHRVAARRLSGRLCGQPGGRRRPGRPGGGWNRCANSSAWISRRPLRYLQWVTNIPARQLRLFLRMERARRGPDLGAAGAYLLHQPYDDSLHLGRGLSDRRLFGCQSVFDWRLYFHHAGVHRPGSAQLFDRAGDHVVRFRPLRPPTERPVPRRSFRGRPGAWPK